MEEKNKKQSRFSLYHLFFAIFLFFILQSYFERSNSSRLPYSEFKIHLVKGDIENVVITGQNVRGEFKKEIQGKKKFETNLVTPEISKELDKYGVKYESSGSSTLSDAILALLPFLLLIFFWFYLIRRGMKGLNTSNSFMSIGKSRAKIYVQKDTKTTFKDVAGADEALEELKEVIDFLKDAEKVKSLGGRMPKGILLVGAPGTGKTLIARAVAGEAGVPFFSTSGSEFVEMFVGVGASRVRDLFEQAKKSAPCIIFIDELDALGKTRRANIVGGNDEKEQTLNQLLVEMDGFDTQGGIIILSATNRPEMIDPALLRAGRFDRQVVVDKPDRKGRRDILAIHLKGVKVQDGIDLDAIAGLTPGFSGADLANLINEAALIATRESAKEVSLDHFTRALERMIAGLEKKNRILNLQEKEIVSHHEMGHALVGYAFNKDEKIHKVSIIAHGIGSMGYTIHRPTEDRYVMSKEELENKMATLLAGRAAEMLIIGHLSTGAADDLVKATNIARDMVMKFGMTEELGYVSYDETSPSYLEIKEIPLRKAYSDETAKTIDESVKKLVMAAYLKAYAYLKSNQDVLVSSANALKDKETLNEDDLKIYFAELSVVVSKTKEVQADIVQKTS
jgi:cell division protease FtsH